MPRRPNNFDELHPHTKCLCIYCGHLVHPEKRADHLDVQIPEFVDAYPSNAHRARYLHCALGAKYCDFLRFLRTNARRYKPILFLNYDLERVKLPLLAAGFNDAQVTEMMAQGPNAIIDHIFPEIALENQMEVAHMRRKFAPMDPGQLREWAQTQGPANLQPFRGRLLETPVKDQEEKKEDLEEEDGGEEGDDGYNDAAPPAISQVLEYYTTNYGIDVAGAHLDDFSTQIWLKLAKMAKAGDAKWRWHLDHLPPEMNKSAAEVFVRWVDVVVEEIMEGGGKY